MTLDFKRCNKQLRAFFDYFEDRVKRDPNIKLISDMIVFAHFTTRRRAQAIKQDGFQGRKLEALFEHTMLLDKASRSPEGFIFAYHVEGYTPEEAHDLLTKKLEASVGATPNDRPFVIMLSNVIYGYAYGGIKISKDDEQQLIIPISCIDESSLLFIEELDVQFPFVWSDDLE